MQAEPTPSPRIVLVDDDASRASDIRTTLTEAGYSVTWTPTSVEGLVAVEDEQPVLVVLRWRMPLIGGKTSLKAVQKWLPDPPPLVVIAEHEDDASMAIGMGARACVEVPIDTTALVDTVHSILNGRSGTTSQ